VLLLGCICSTFAVTAACTPRASPGEILTPPPSVTALHPRSPAEEILVRYAGLLTEGNVEQAAGLLASPLREIVSTDRYAPLRNTPGMEIVRLENRDGLWEPSLGRRTNAPVAEVHVFYVEARYRVLGITTSYFKDGEIYYHKSTVAKFTEGWLITEMSGRPGPDP
jgi:hypothetical protein